MSPARIVYCYLFPLIGRPQDHDVSEAVFITLLLPACGRFHVAGDSLYRTRCQQ